MKRGKVESVQKLWLNKDEAMAYLGCSVDYLDKLRNNAQVSFAKDGKMIWKVGEKTIPKNTSVRFDYVGDYTAEPFTTPVKNTEFSEKPIRYQETQSILCGIYDFYHGFQLK